MRLVLDARTAAFAALIDYAGLFPPSSLEMHDAVATYRQLRSGPRAWVAGRFLCRTSQLRDLAAVATSTFASGEHPWEIGAIFDLPPGESAALAADFHAEMEPVMTVATAEARLVDPTARSLSALLDAVFSVGAEVVPYIEVDRAHPVEHQIGLIADALDARHRIGGAKLRRGGARPDLVPAPSAAARLLATAPHRTPPSPAPPPLHQPIRHFDDGLGVWQHGFVNLVIASALAATGASLDTLEAAIAETDVKAFAMSTAFASWTSHEIPGSALRRMRQSGFVAYGSCDIDEPIDALEELGFIGEGA